MRRTFALGILAGFALAGCAGFFPYKYYGMHLESYEGSLLGPKPKDDLPFTVCEPDPTPSVIPSGPQPKPNRGKCVVMLSDEFFAMKQDMLETKKRLVECEHAANP